jgi:aurora kinase
MELKMQLIFKHANVLRMYGYFDDSEHIYLILEYMEQGTMFGQLRK